MSGEVTSVTGELFTGWRTAAVEVVLPATSVVQMSADPDEYHKLCRRN
jgi:hypothetical protein